MKVSQGIEKVCITVGAGPALVLCKAFHIGEGSRNVTSQALPLVLGSINLLVTLPIWLPLTLLGGMFKKLGL